MGLFNPHSYADEATAEEVNDFPENDKKEEKPVSESTEEKENTKKKKFKVQYIPITIGGVAVTGALIASGVAKYNNAKTYNNKMNDHFIASSSMYDLIDKDKTSLDEILDQDVDMYNAYEKYRNIIVAKKQYIDPKEYKIKEYSYFVYDYNNINVERLSQLSDFYYTYLTEMENNTPGSEKYENAKRQFESVCIELNSIRHSINEYQNTYGTNLVKGIAADVAAAKLIDDKKLDPEHVSNIQGQFTSDGNMTVSFDYDKAFKKDEYSTAFKKDGYDDPNKIAEFITSGNELDAIRATKIFAEDTDFDGFKKVR